MFFFQFSNINAILSNGINKFNGDEQNLQFQEADSFKSVRPVEMHHPNLETSQPRGGCWLISQAHTHSLCEHEIREVSFEI